MKVTKTIPIEVSSDLYDRMKIAVAKEGKRQQTFVSIRSLVQDKCIKVIEKTLADIEGKNS